MPGPQGGMPGPQGGMPAACRAPFERPDKVHLRWEIKELRPPGGDPPAQKTGLRWVSRFACSTGLASAKYSYDGGPIE